MDTHSPFSSSLFPHITRSLNETGVLNFTLPHSTGTTLQDEIQCYSIPYGLVGFLSHLISYYTLAITGAGRRPLAPWLPLEKKNLFVSILQLLGTVGLAIYTIYACHDRWQFVLVGVWKLLWNCEKAGFQMAAGWRASREYSIEKASRNRDVRSRNQMELALASASAEKNSSNAMRGMLYQYTAAAIIGLVGVASLVKLTAHQTPHVLVITEAFGGTVAVIFAFGIGIALASICVRDLREMIGLLLLLPFMAVVVLFALYSDWILGAIANNLLGNPQENRAFYWTYFAFKHLALLML